MDTSRTRCSAPLPESVSVVLPRTTLTSFGSILTVPSPPGSLGVQPPPPPVQSGSPSATQCAAVITTEAVTRDPPQNCRWKALAPGDCAGLYPTAPCQG